MYDFRIEGADKPELWRQLVQAAEALTGGNGDSYRYLCQAGPPGKTRAWQHRSSPRR